MIEDDAKPELEALVASTGGRIRKRDEEYPRIHLLGNDLGTNILTLLPGFVYSHPTPSTTGTRRR